MHRDGRDAPIADLPALARRGECSPQRRRSPSARSLVTQLAGAIEIICDARLRDTSDAVTLTIFAPGRKAP